MENFICQSHLLNKKFWQSHVKWYIYRYTGLLSPKLVLIQGDKYISCFMRFFNLDFWLAQVSASSVIQVWITFTSKSRQCTAVALKWFTLAENLVNFLKPLLLWYKYSAKSVWNHGYIRILIFGCNTYVRGYVNKNVWIHVLLPSVGQGINVREYNWVTQSPLMPYQCYSWCHCICR